MKRVLLGFLFVLFLGVLPAVAFTDPLVTVRVTINSENRKAIKDELVGYMIGKGFSIAKDSEYQISFDKEVPNFFYLNLRTGQYPVARGVFNIAPVSGATLVTASPYIVYNPGSGHEIVQTHSNKEDTVGLQRTLYKLKSAIDGTPYEELEALLPQKKKPAQATEASTGKQIVMSGIKTIDQEGRITEIEKGSLAEKAGLKSGDIIIEVNAKPVDVGNIKTWLEDIDNRINAGRSVMVLYERDSYRDLVTLKRKP